MTWIINDAVPWPTKTRDKIAAISQMTFSNAFYWVKLFEFCLRFPLSLILRFELTILIHWIYNQICTHGIKWWFESDYTLIHYRTKNETGVRWCPYWRHSPNFLWYYQVAPNPYQMSIVVSPWQHNTFLHLKIFIWKHRIQGLKIFFPWMYKINI